MKLTPKMELFVATGILGVLLGALWALVARGPETLPIAPTLARPKLQSREEKIKLPPPSGEQVGRLDPFQSLLPNSAPESPKEEARLKPEVFLPPALPTTKPHDLGQGQSPPPPKPTLPWKLVGLGAGQEQMALVKKGGEVLVLHRGEQVDGWTLTEIREQAVVFSRGKDQVTIAMEEVFFNETDS